MTYVLIAVLFLASLAMLVGLSQTNTEPVRPVPPASTEVRPSLADVVWRHWRTDEMPILRSGSVRPARRVVAADPLPYALEVFERLAGPRFTPLQRAWIEVAT